MGARLTRLLAYAWASPNTVIGLLLGVLSFQRPRRTGGILVYDARASGFIWVLAKLKRAAITFGHVVLSNQRIEGRLQAHELHHVWQYERLGPLYIPIYLLAWVFMGYKWHPFEMAARLAEEATPAGRP